MPSRQCFKKQRCHFANKGLYCQSYGFFSNHLRMWECGHKKGWVLKNWCFQTVVLEKAARRSNQSILKEINPEYSLEGLMLKLKPQNFDYLMWRADSLEKTLMLEKIEGKRRRGWQRMRRLDKFDSMDINLRKLWETVKDRGAWCAAVYGIPKSQTRLNDWTTTTILPYNTG